MMTHLSRSWTLKDTIPTHPQMTASRRGRLSLIWWRLPTKSTKATTQPQWLQEALTPIWRAMPLSNQSSRFQTSSSSRRDKRASKTNSSPMITLRSTRMLATIARSTQKIPRRSLTASSSPATSKPSTSRAAARCSAGSTDSPAVQSTRTSPSWLQESRRSSRPTRRSSKRPIRSRTTETLTPTRSTSAKLVKTSLLTALHNGLRRRRSSCVGLESSSWWLLWP